jgi:hypothetical protein
MEGVEREDVYHVGYMQSSTLVVAQAGLCFDWLTELGLVLTSPFLIYPQQTNEARGPSECIVTHSALGSLSLPFSSLSACLILSFSSSL